MLNRTPDIRRMVRVAMLSAIAYLLWLPAFEIPMFLPWLKLDFSNVPVLLAGFAMGPAAGVATALIKALLHIPMGSSAGIGELADFLCALALMLPASLIMKHIHGAGHRARAVGGMLLGVVLSVAVSVLANKYLLLPMYGALYGMEDLLALAENPAIDSVFTLLIYGVVPFNLVKGLVLTLVTGMLYKPLVRFLK